MYDNVRRLRKQMLEMVLGTSEELLEGNDPVVKDEMNILNCKVRRMKECQ